MAMMPDMVQRLGWSADRIRREREDRLRDLLRQAKAARLMSTDFRPYPPSAVH
jgi:hypothetical protein